MTSSHSTTSVRKRPVFTFKRGISPARLLMAEYSSFGGMKILLFYKMSISRNILGSSTSGSRRRNWHESRKKVRSLKSERMAPIVDVRTTPVTFSMDVTSKILEHTCKHHRILAPLSFEFFKGNIATGWSAIFMGVEDQLLFALKHLRNDGSPSRSLSQYCCQCLCRLNRKQREGKAQ